MSGFFILGVISHFLYVARGAKFSGSAKQVMLTQITPPPNPLLKQVGLEKGHSTYAALHV